VSFDLSKILVIGISSRALFDLEKENEIFEGNGLEAYTKYQLEHVEDTPRPGTGFRLVKNILCLNTNPSTPKVEVIVLSRNNAATSLRITKAIEYHGLDITRSAWTGGDPISKYLGPYKVDLFLSANESDVQEAINAGFAAGRIYKVRKYTPVTRPDKQKIKIAFDGDAVIFSSESEKIYQTQGLEAFLENEKKNALKPLPEGPFAPLLKALARAQSEFTAFNAPIRTALITARNSPAHERVVRTLAEWGVRVDEVHFLGGVDKREIVEAFGADIYFDDQDVHCTPASEVVPTAIVPYRDKDGMAKV
jgi:5'-nucleotidase